MVRYPIITGLTFFISCSPSLSVADIVYLITGSTSHHHGPSWTRDHHPQDNNTIISNIKTIIFYSLNEARFL